MANRNPVVQVTFRQLMRVTYLGIPFPIAAVVAFGAVLALVVFG